MTFEERLTLGLVSLAHESLDRELYAYVEDFANFLKALKSGRWQQLPSDEQILWVRRLKTRLGGRDGLVEWLGYKHAGLDECMTILSALEKALERASQDSI